MTIQTEPNIELVPRPEAVRDTALNRLRALLDRGRFPVDSRLPPERSLAVELGVSRRALRQALAVLEAEGKIWRNVGKGTFVGGRSVKDRGDLSLISGLTNPEEVMEVRLQLEPRIARLAALRATTDDIAHLWRCVRKSEQAGGYETYERWDGTLHRTVAEAAHNRLLLALFDAVNAVRVQTAWGRLRHAALTPERQADYCRDHRAFVEAIAARDAPGAELLMQRHIERVRRNLLGAASPAPEDPREAAAESTAGDGPPSSFN